MHDVTMCPHEDTKTRRCVYVCVCMCAADRREAGNSWLESEPDFRWVEQTDEQSPQQGPAGRHESTKTIIIITTIISRAISSFTFTWSNSDTGVLVSQFCLFKFRHNMETIRIICVKNSLSNELSNIVCRPYILNVDPTADRAVSEQTGHGSNWTDEKLNDR